MRAILLLAFLLQLPLQEAVTLVRQGNFAEAKKRLEGQAEPVDPRRRVAYHRLRAAIASGLGQVNEAASEMNAALALAPDDADLQAAAAFALLENAQVDEAIALLQHAGTSAQVLTLSGIAAYAKGDFKDAEVILNRAIHQDQRYEPAYRSLSQIVLESSASPSRDTIASLCSWNKVVCSAVALRTSRENGDRSAREQAMAVLRSAPAGDRVASCALGQAYGWANQWPAARKELERCVKLNPTAQNHYRLAMAYQRLGQAALARQQLAARARLLGSQPEDLASGREVLRQLPH